MIQILHCSRGAYIVTWRRCTDAVNYFGHHYHDPSQLHMRTDWWHKLQYSNCCCGCSWMAVMAALQCQVNAESLPVFPSLLHSDCGIEDSIGTAVFSVPLEDSPTLNNLSVAAGPFNSVKHCKLSWMQSVSLRQYTFPWFALFFSIIIAWTLILH